MTFYLPEDLPFLDLLWFAVDKNNKIAALSTGATGLFPTFLSIENYRFVKSYFCNEIHDICDSMDDQGLGDVSLDFAQSFSKKGVYVYFAQESEEKPEVYDRYTSPSIPLAFDDIQEDIQVILDVLRLPVEFKHCLRIDKRDIPSPYF